MNVPTYVYNLAMNIFIEILLLSFAMFLSYVNLFMFFRFFGKRHEGYARDAHSKRNETLFYFTTHIFRCAYRHTHILINNISVKQIAKTVMLLYSK